MLIFHVITMTNTGNIKCVAAMHTLIFSIRLYGVQCLTLVVIMEKFASQIRCLVAVYFSAVIR